VGFLHADSPRELTRSTVVEKRQTGVVGLTGGEQEGGERREKMMGGGSGGGKGSRNGEQRV